MASDAALTAPWPHGTYYPIYLGPLTYFAEQQDTTGEERVASFKTPFAFNVKKAFLWIAEGTLAEGGSDTIAVKDDSSSQITVVASRNLSTADDAGTYLELTVADEGPILGNSELSLYYENNGTGEVVGMTVLLWVSPVHADTGLPLIL